MSSKFYLLAGHMIDGTGAPARRDLLIKVEGGIVTSLRQIERNEKRPQEREYVDFSDCTILPGLVDCHVHLTWSGTVDPVVRKEQLHFTFDQSRTLIHERIRKNLSYGVMALRDGGDSEAFTLRFKKECLPALEFPVQLKAAGNGWRSPGRYGKIIAREPEDGLTLAKCIERQGREADHIKIINSGLNSLAEFGRATAPQFSQEELRAAVLASRRLGRKVMVHANGKAPVTGALEAGCDSIEHGYFMGGDNLRRLAELGITWVPTAFAMKALFLNLPPGGAEAQIAERTFEHQLEQVAMARRMGVRVGIGTDSGGFGLHHGQAYIEELKALVLAGFSAEELIRCAAQEGARLLGLEDELGRILPGMPASFIVAQGAPADLPGSLGSLKNVYFRGIKVV